MTPRTLLIREPELARFVSGGTLADRAYGLLQQQRTVWPLARDGYNSLASVRVRSFSLDRFLVKVQYNPGRMTSTSARVDPESIRQRKCFLCPDNLPLEQRGIGYGSEYVLLCNPFPIFPEHFTISHRDHVPQRILPAFGTLLDLSRDLRSSYCVIYNGPRCGASAPDHLHLQAGNKYFMPVDSEFESLARSPSARLTASGGLQTFSVSSYLRRFLAFQTADRETLLRCFRTFYELYGSLKAFEDEPMMNIIASYDDNGWRLLIFPREKHRPEFYFFEDERQIMISPAAVDLGGVCITPREKDFEAVTEGDIARMFEEVSLAPRAFDELVGKLKESLRSES